MNGKHSKNASVTEGRCEQNTTEWSSWHKRVRHKRVAANAEQPTSLECPSCGESRDYHICSDSVAIFNVKRFKIMSF